MKPEYVLIDWSKGAVFGVGSEEECRAMLAKATRSSDHGAAYLLAEVKVLSEMKRVES